MTKKELEVKQHMLTMKEPTAMRKLLVILVSLLIPATAFAAVPVKNLSTYTQAQLVTLRQQIDSLIIVSNAGDEVYSNDIVVIKWLGVDDEGGNYFKNIFLISNPTGRSIWFAPVSIAYNGIVFAMANNFDYEIEPGMALLSSSYNCWLIKKADLATVGLSPDSASEVSFRFKILDGESWDANVILTDSAKFAVNK